DAVQDEVAAEAMAVFAGGAPDFAALRRLAVTRDVFRETLRLYPPVPMMVREAARPERFRGRPVRPGSLVILSPWHLQRHRRLWADPDGFDPLRWRSAAAEDSARAAWLPFSAGPRVCIGAGFAMLEGVLTLARLAAAFRFAPVPERTPRPVAHLTVRSADGIWLELTPRT
ncbi:MAG TPA: cytochrome P450, partial [Paracoccaceae bacterium]|nr:cytochrome P450 [Paracoccaceae bacterium]